MSPSQRAIKEVTDSVYLMVFRHMFFMTQGKEEEVTANTDQFMDSYARDTTVDELKDVRDFPIKASEHSLTH